MADYSDINRRFDAGDVTEAEAQRHGWNHKGYGWGCNPPGHWSEELQQAYTAGYKGEQHAPRPSQP